MNLCIYFSRRKSDDDDYKSSSKSHKRSKKSSRKDRESNEKDSTPAVVKTETQEVSGVAAGDKQD